MLSTKDFIYVCGLFDDPTDPVPDDPITEPDNIIRTTDIEPAVSYDHINGITEGYKRLMEVLGVSRMRRVQAGASVKVYKTTVESVGEQVAEGETIPLSKVTRKLAKTIPITLKKYRKQVTAEAIMADGYEHAVNDTDNALVARVRKAVKATFFANIESGEGTATGGTNLQAAMASALAALYSKYEDSDVTPLFVVNYNDAYTYLGQAAISTQNAFGFSYLQNFLGLGDVILTSEITAGTVWVMAKENLNGVYPDGGSDVARAMGMSADPSGIVLMKHSTGSDSDASLYTVLMTGVVFYAEDLSGVFKSVIG
jgi:hypothetical protein